MGLVLGCQAREGSHARRPREFDGSRAFGYVEQQMAFGPRIPGTPGHERAGDWLVAQFRARADTVWVQSFAHVTQRGDKIGRASCRERRESVASGGASQE